MTSTSPYSDTGRGEVDDGQQEWPVNADTLNMSAVSGLPQQQPPLASSCWLHGGTPTPGEVSVIASRAALQQITAHSNSDPDREVGGALLGRAFRNEERIYVEVAAAIPAVSQDHGPVHFTFNADSWARLQEQRAIHHPDLDIVGWFHTHPNLGVFYSSDDVVVHSAAFTLPWHVGLVIDPIRSEAGLFGWLGGKLTPYSGFYERHLNQSESAISWRVVKSAVYDAPHEAQSMTSRQSHILAPQSGWPSLPSLAGPMGLVIGSIGLLLGFFLLVGWVIPLNRQIGYLEDLTLMMADQGEGSGNTMACPDARLRILKPLADENIPIGSKYRVLGTADYPNAARYRVEVRPAGDGGWTLVDSRFRDTRLGQLALWDTEGLAPAKYEMRLAAVDRNSVILAGSASCTVSLELQR